MAQLIRDIIHGYHDVMDNKSDPRVNQWSMMASPFPTLAICLAYAYFAKVLGPRLMENRKPFNLRNVLIVYNFLQTIFSSWIFYEDYLVNSYVRPAKTDRKLRSGSLKGLSRSGPHSFWSPRT
uniref:Elongation of very long chain fatty acids protein n=1 Tax=Timema tahoe TaxID=61484 RepID=A0A7R9FGK4_9NEOP|nr:unnamed protein product [Timema tahoe]